VDLRALPPDLLLAAGAAAALVALVQTLRLFFRRWARRRRLALARAQGAAGEVRAEEILLRLGYRILGRQVCVTYGVGVDGREIAVDLRADYVVSRDLRRYVAEVKTGRLAPRIDTPATRRQLLEYRLAFDVDGVLLVDADAERVHRVVFPLPGRERSQGSRITWLLLGLAAGAIAATAARGL
jgi:hypothetical protein